MNNGKIIIKSIVENQNFKEMTFDFVPPKGDLCEIKECLLNEKEED